MTSTEEVSAKQKGMCIATRCTSIDHFVEMFHRFVDEDSFFVSTNNTRPPGLETSFSVQLADGTPVLRGICVVLQAWTNANSPFKTPGVRLGIKRLTASSMPVFERLLVTRPVVRAATIPPPSRVPDSTPTQVRETNALAENVKTKIHRPDTVTNVTGRPEETRTPGSDLVLPANPLMNLSDDSLNGYIDCTLYEETANYFPTETLAADSLVPVVVPANPLAGEDDPPLFAPRPVSRTAPPVELVSDETTPGSVSQMLPLPRTNTGRHPTAQPLVARIPEPGLPAHSTGKIVPMSPAHTTGRITPAAHTTGRIVPSAPPSHSTGQIVPLSSKRKSGELPPRHPTGQMVPQTAAGTAPPSFITGQIVPLAPPFAVARAVPPPSPSPMEVVPPPPDDDVDEFQQVPSVIIEKPIELTDDELAHSSYVGPMPQPRPHSASYVGPAQPGSYGPRPHSASYAGQSGSIPASSSYVGPMPPSSSYIGPMPHSPSYVGPMPMPPSLSYAPRESIPAFGFASRDSAPAGEMAPMATVPVRMPTPLVTKRRAIIAGGAAAAMLLVAFVALGGDKTPAPAKAANAAMLDTDAKDSAQPAVADKPVEPAVDSPTAHAPAAPEAEPAMDSAETAESDDASEGGMPITGEGPCRVAVASTPAGSMVHLDGAVVAPSPITIATTCAAHKVEIKHPRYKLLTKQVSPTEEAPANVEVTLQRPTHSVTFTSQPAGATIFIDGRRAGTTPTTVNMLGFSNLKIEVKKTGYKPVSTRHYSKVPQDKFSTKLSKW